MKRRDRNPIKDAKLVVEKVVAELTTTDIYYYLGKSEHDKDIDAENILDIIEAATVNLRWEG